MAQKAPKFPVGLFAYNDFRRSPATKMERIPFPRIPQNLKLLDKIPANIELIASLSEVQNRPEFRTRSFFFSLFSFSWKGLVWHPGRSLLINQLADAITASEL